MPCSSWGFRRVALRFAHAAYSLELLNAKPMLESRVLGVGFDLPWQVLEWSRAATHIMMPAATRMAPGRAPARASRRGPGSLSGSGAVRLRPGGTGARQCPRPARGPMRGRPPAAARERHAARVSLALVYTLWQVAATCRGPSLRPGPASARDPEAPSHWHCQWPGPTAQVPPGPAPAAVSESHDRDFTPRLLGPGRPLADRGTSRGTAGGTRLVRIILTPVVRLD